MLVSQTAITENFVSWRLRSTVRLSKLVLFPSILLKKILKLVGSEHLKLALEIWWLKSEIDLNALQFSRISDAIWNSSLQLIESIRVPLF